MQQPPKIRYSCDNPIEVVNPRYRKYSAGELRHAQHLADYKIIVPCGHCLTCRQRRARNWHFRLYHEACACSLHTFTDHKGKHVDAPRILFCTFTFNDKHLPHVPKNKQEREILAPFIRKWRDGWRKRFGVSPRYFAISDIGGDSGRLHFHLLIFDPRDRHGKPIKKSQIYTYNRDGETVLPPWEQLGWRYGFCTYCGWLRGMQGVHYAAGYINMENAIKEAEKGKGMTKHRKPLCLKARLHFASIFCSPGLGKKWFESSEFSQLRSTKAAVCRIGKYTYSVPRYYRLRYWDPIVIPGVSPVIVSREQQMSAYNSRYMHKMMSSIRGPVVIHGPTMTFTNAAQLAAYRKKLKDLYLDPSFVYVMDPPRPMPTYCENGKFFEHEDLLRPRRLVLRGFKNLHFEVDNPRPRRKKKRKHTQPLKLF